MPAADTSMAKFMGDTSIADYVQMIDGPTIKMSRYAIDKSFDSEDSRFVEIMAFGIKPVIDMSLNEPNTEIFSNVIEFSSFNFSSSESPALRHKLSEEKKITKRNFIQFSIIP